MIASLGRLIVAAVVAGTWLLHTGLIPARAEDVREINIGIQFGFAYLPVVVADHENLFAAQARQAGLGELKVQLQRFSGPSSINDALLTSRLEIGALGVPGMLIAWDKTRNSIRIHGLAGIVQLPYVLYSNNPAVHTIHDFTESDRIAVTGINAPQALMLRIAAERTFGQAEASRFDTLLVSLPHPDSMAALLSGSGITAYFATPPFSGTLAQDSRVHHVTSAAEILGKNATGAVLTTTRRFFEQNPAAVRAVVAAIEEAMALIAADHRKAAEIYLATETSSLTREQVEQLLADPGMRYTVEPSGVMAYADFMARTGQIRNRPASWQDVFFPLIHDRPGD